MTHFTILAISGSLRAHSSNTELLRAAALVAPSTVRVTLFAGLADLPHFNPDLDKEGSIPTAAVAHLRREVSAASAILICSPEYAHGVPGVLKNALDWLVSGPEIVFKPIGLLSASPESRHARDSLAETLRTMSTRIVPEASATFSLRGSRVDGAGLAALPDVAETLRAAIDALVRSIDVGG